MGRGRISPYLSVCLLFSNVTIMTWLNYSQTKKSGYIKFGKNLTQYNSSKS